MTQGTYRESDVTARQYEVVGEPTARAAFITRTYVHLLGAVLAFTCIEWFLFSSGIAWGMARAMLSTSWLLVLGGFMLVSWIASLKRLHRCCKRNLLREIERYYFILLDWNLFQLFLAVCMQD